MRFIFASSIILLLLPGVAKAQFSHKPGVVVQDLAVTYSFHPLRGVTGAYLQFSLDIFNPASVVKFKLKTLNNSSKQLSSMQKGYETESTITFDIKGRITSVLVKSNDLYSTFWECTYEDDVFGKETRYFLSKDQQPYLTCESTYGQTGFLVHKKYSWSWRENTNYVYAFPESEEMFSYDSEHRLGKYIFQHENRQKTIQFQFMESRSIILKQKETTKNFKAVEGVNEEESRDLLESTEALATYDYDSDYTHLEGITTETTGSYKYTSSINYRYDEKDNLSEMEYKGEIEAVYSKQVMSYNSEGHVIKMEMWEENNNLIGTYRMEYKTHKNGDQEQWTTYITDKANTNARVKYSRRNLLLESSSDNNDYNSETKKTTKTTLETILTYTFWE